MKSNVQSIKKKRRRTLTRSSIIVLVIMSLAIIYGIFRFEHALEQIQNKQDRTSINMTPFSEKYVTKNLKVTPETTLNYENKNLGYLIDYSERLTYTDSDEVIFSKKDPTVALPSEIILKPISNSYNNAKTFEESIIEISSVFCAGNGPVSTKNGEVVMGEMSCPKELISLQKFQNKYNNDGYILERTVVAEANDVIQWEKKEIVVFFPLRATDDFALMIEMRSSDREQKELEQEFLLMVDSFRYKDNK